MGFKGFLCCFLVSLILHEVYSSKSELACERYQHLRQNFQNVNKTCLEEKVIEGNDCNINEVPHMVAIGYDNEDGGSPYVIQCSGILISEKFVLTAAHCVNNRLHVPRIVRLGKVIAIQSLK